MGFTTLQLILIAAAVLVAGVLFGRLTKKSDTEGFLSRIFQNNKDFDSTLDRVLVAVIAIFMLIAFHDDFSDPARAAQITVIFLGVLNLWGQIVLGKAVRDMHNGIDRSPP